jgi:hypothetical protein
MKLVYNSRNEKAEENEMPKELIRRVADCLTDCDFFDKYPIVQVRTFNRVGPEELWNMENIGNCRLALNFLVMPNGKSIRVRITLVCPGGLVLNANQIFKDYVDLPYWITSNLEKMKNFFPEEESTF